jgi:hypothetical protein
LFKDDINQNKEVLVEYILKLDYTLEPNIFNFVLNLILDKLDYDTAIQMFELVFDAKLKRVDLSSIDVSKTSLKLLLKIQT